MDPSSDTSASSATAPATAATQASSTTATTPTISTAATAATAGDASQTPAASASATATPAASGDGTAITAASELVRAARPAFAVEIVTLVPELWSHLLSAESGLVGKAFATGVARLALNDLRAFGKGVHHSVDDAPFGGGAGMVLAVEPLHRAITAARARSPGPVLLLSPRGRPFTQSVARELAAGPGLTLICGRYEGVDERVRRYIDAELSIGDYVLSAGDPAAWCIVDAVVRLLPGVLGNPESLAEESFAHGLLEYPQYTRPAEYEGMKVPDVLRSGDHAAVERWRRERALKLTQEHRPDLLEEEGEG